MRGAFGGAKLSLILTICGLCESSFALNVFDQDDRTLVSAHDFYIPNNPIRQIVHIKQRSGDNVWHCTGSLVWKNLVLTNAHCVDETFKKQKNGKWKYNASGLSIYSFYTSGTYVEEASVLEMIIGQTPDDVNDINQTTPNDWALLRINKNLGDRLGYFGVLTNNHQVGGYFNEGLTLAGYSGDIEWGLNLSSHSNCSIHKHGGIWGSGFLQHDCDSRPGSSGSPLFKCDKKRGCYLVAIHAGEHRLRKNSNGKEPTQVPYSTSTSNLAVNPAKFSQSILKLRKAYPNGAVEDVSTIQNFYAYESPPGSSKSQDIDTYQLEN